MNINSSLPKLLINSVKTPGSLSIKHQSPAAAVMMMNCVINDNKLKWLPDEIKFENRVKRDGKKKTSFKILRNQTERWRSKTQEQNESSKQFVSICLHVFTGSFYWPIFRSFMIITIYLIFLDGKSLVPVIVWIKCREMFHWMMFMMEKSDNIE